MASLSPLPAGFSVGSDASGRGVFEAIESYRRAQNLIVGSGVASNVSDDEDRFSEVDEEAELGLAEQEMDEDTVEEVTTPEVTTPDDEFIGEFDWGDELPSQRPPPPRLPFSRKVLLAPALRPVMNERHYSERTARRTARNEHTPLLRKTLSFTDTPPPRRTFTTPTETLGVPFTGMPNYSGRPARRRSSTTSARSMRYNYRGQSTFGQTLFNSLAILIGIGILSEPLGFAYTGWGTGLVLITFYGYISCYTAKILANIIVSDPRLFSYADIARKAFGPRSTVVVSILSCLRLFAASSILVTLYADSLNTLIPRYSCTTYKLWGILILTPTVFLPLSLLSYASILGIISTVLVVFIILADGLSKAASPGSLRDPAPTSLGIDSYNHMAIAFGLFMAGFAGHAVIPSLARDMVDPGEFSRMINWAFAIATSVYTLIAAAGYLMFGNAVSAEISMDMLATPGYNTALNQAALWMLVLTPLSKFALTTQPLNTTIQILLGIRRPLDAPEEPEATNNFALEFRGRRIPGKRALRVVQRVAVTLLSVAASILVPEFSAAVAFLGSFSAFILCVIEPIAAKIALERRCGLFDGFVLLLAVGMAIWGTKAALEDAAD